MDNSCGVAHIPTGRQRRRHVQRTTSRTDTRTNIAPGTKNGGRSLLPADKSAVSGHLKKALGSRNIRLAHPDAIRDLTGYEIGSIPPFHWQPPGFRSFIEAALMQEDVLGVGAGEWGHEIMIAPQHLVQAAQAVVVNLTDRSKPIFEGGASPGV